MEKPVLYMRKGGVVSYTWDDICYLVDSGQANMDEFIVIFEE